MSALLNPRLEPFLQRAVDLGERAFFILLYVTFVVSVWRSLALRPYNILALISESFVVFFIIIRRDARTVTMRPLDWLIALVGTALPLVVRPGGDSAVPTIVGTALMVAGLSISIWAKLILRRSFGVAAANRGLVDAGPYRFIRHPMYAGYLIVYVGFLLNNPLARNLGIYTLVAALLVARILAEERLLAQDPNYAAFMSRVRYRLAPGLF